MRINDILGKHKNFIMLKKSKGKHLFQLGSTMFQITSIVQVIMDIEMIDFHTAIYAKKVLQTL